MKSSPNTPPNGWHPIKLGDVLKYEQPYKYAVDSIDYTERTGVPILTAGKTFVLGYTNNPANTYTDLPVIIFDDFTTDTKFVDFQFKVKSSAMKFLKERTTEEISLKFIFEILQSLKIDLTGGEHKRRWISEFSKIVIYGPEYSEQVHIAHILSTIDSVINNTKQVIAKYRRVKTGLMQDLLTKGIDRRGNVRSEETHHFKTESGLRMPEEWRVDTLGSLIEAVDAHPSHRTPPVLENGIPYIGISDIDEYGNIDFTKCRKVANSVLLEHKKRYQLRDGDIIFGKIGTIGEPKRLKAFADITISANVILIQPHDTPDFVFWVLNSDYVHTQVSNSVHSTSQPAFGMGKIRALTVLVPPKEERVRIQEVLNHHETNLLCTKKLLGKLQLLRAGLTQDLLSGKTPIPKGMITKMKKKK